MESLRRSSSSSRRRSSSVWCCSFTVPPASPDPRGYSKPLKNANPPIASAASFHSSPSPASTAAAKLGRRILSPGRVSPIDSESDPPSLAPLPELPSPPRSSSIPDPEISSFVETTGDGMAPSSSMDLRLRLRGRDGRFFVLELDSRVLCENSEVLRKLVAAAEEEEGWREMEVEDLGAFRETIEMMYVEEEEELTRGLARAGVSRSIDLLEVSSKIKFDRGVVACLNYIEAVPWSESEEEKLKSLFEKCSFDEDFTQDILARLHPGGTSGSEDLATMPHLTCTEIVLDLEKEHGSYLMEVMESLKWKRVYVPARRMILPLMIFVVRLPFLMIVVQVPN